MSSFWSEYQPGFRATSAKPGSLDFFAEVERERYSLEPHIPAALGFAHWAGRDVLEAGCGIGTDGLRYASAGARYTGVDQSEAALDLARRRFELDGQEGNFVHGSVTELPFSDDSFDLVVSHGVVHHIADTEAAVAEFHRVLRPGGLAIVMVYHRNSLNYYVTIMSLRRALVGALAVPGGSDLVARITGESAEVLDGHERLLREHGIRYITRGDLFLSNNTDGPGNPLSKVYSKHEAAQLFRQFEHVRFAIRYLNLRTYPKGVRLARTALAERLGRRFGWHLYVYARKGAPSPIEVGAA